MKKPVWLLDIDGVINAYNGPRAQPGGYTSLSRRPKWWKLPAARRVLQFEQRPLLWSDDDTVDLDTQLRQRMAALGQPLLIVAPDPRTGLTAADLTSIDAFLTGQTGDAKSQPIRERMQTNELVE